MTAAIFSDPYATTADAAAYLAGQAAVSQVAGNPAIEKRAFTGADLLQKLRGAVAGFKGLDPRYQAPLVGGLGGAGLGGLAGLLSASREDPEDRNYGASALTGALAGGALGAGAGLAAPHVMGWRGKVPDMKPGAAGGDVAQKIKELQAYGGQNPAVAPDVAKTIAQLKSQQPPSGLIERARDMASRAYDQGPFGFVAKHPVTAAMAATDYASRKIRGWADVKSQEIVGGSEGATVAQAKDALKNFHRAATQKDPTGFMSRWRQAKQPMPAQAAAYKNLEGLGNLSDDELQSVLNAARGRTAPFRTAGMAQEINPADVRHLMSMAPRKDALGSLADLWRRPKPLPAGGASRGGVHSDFPQMGPVGGFNMASNVLETKRLGGLEGTWGRMRPNLGRLGRGLLYPAAAMADEYLFNKPQPPHLNLDDAPPEVLPGLRGFIHQVQK